MKIRKRILSLVLAVMLIVAMAVPASAATVWTTRTGNGCTVGLSGECGVLDYSAAMEYQSSDSGDPSDYLLQIRLVRTTLRANDAQYIEGVQWSGASTHITRISGRSDWVLYKMECAALVNGYLAGQPVTVYGN